MSNQRANGPEQDIGEMWVGLSRDDKKKICDALIDRNQPDVMQEFATLVRFTRGYLQKQPTKDKPAAPDHQLGHVRPLLHARKRRAHSNDDGPDEIVKNEVKNEIKDEVDEDYEYYEDYEY